MDRIKKKSNNIIEELNLQPLTEEEKQEKHILGRLYGPIATSKEGTRNGRKYNKELWEKALNDPLMDEKVKNKCLFLELGHPLDGREETLMEKVCACIPELPKIDNNGDLIAYIDILDTPNGKILKTLCDYGFVPGISSRGSGDVVGDEVDPESFQLETWDIVQIPALTKARLQVQESLNKNTLQMKQALCESLDKASDKDKIIMEDALNKLGINIKEEDDKKECNSENCADKVEGNSKPEEADKNSKEANDNGSKEIVKSLQETLKTNLILKAKLKKLQEDLAVSDTKVKNLNETLLKYKNTTIRLSDIASNSRKQLVEKVNKLEKTINMKDEDLNNKEDEIKSLKENIQQYESDRRFLNESINSKDDKVKSLKEDLNKQIGVLENKVNELSENLNSKTEDLNTLNEKLDSTNKKLQESINTAKYYKQTANAVVNRYICSQARMLGVKPEEIKNRLKESYTIDDIDNICEDLKSYSLNISKLPFNVDKNVKIQVNESKGSDPLRNIVVNDDDDISPGLMRLSGLK